MPNASYTHLPKLLIKAGLACGKGDVDDDSKDIAKKVSSISVLELEDCSKKVKDEFALLNIERDEVQLINIIGTMTLEDIKRCMK